MVFKSVQLSSSEEQSSEQNNFSIKRLFDALHSKNAEKHQIARTHPIQKHKNPTIKDQKREQASDVPKGTLAPRESV
jgi:hypothetical protein